MYNLWLIVHIFLTLLLYGHIFIRNVKSTIHCSLIRGPYSELRITNIPITQQKRLSIMVSYYIHSFSAV